MGGKTRYARCLPAWLRAFRRARKTSSRCAPRGDTSGAASAAALPPQSSFPSLRWSPCRRVLFFRRAPLPELFVFPLSLRLTCLHRLCRTGQFLGAKKCLYPRQIFSGFAKTLERFGLPRRKLET